MRCVRGNAYGASAFVNNGDGSVSDKATGLVWQQADDGVARGWSDAMAYCDGLSLAGHDDWRLPNHKELQYIADYSGYYPAIDPGYFSTADPDGWFWTSTQTYVSPSQNTLDWAWYVAFGYANNREGQDLHGAGAVRFAPLSSNAGGEDKDQVRPYNYARCVRGYSAALSVDTEFSGQTSTVDFAPAGQGFGNGQPPASGQQGSSSGSQGPGGQPPDLATAAAQLGVTEQALRAALGEPGQGPPDLSAAASQLGVSAQDLITTLGLPADGLPQGGN